jgi:hypothetical protein
VERLSVADFDPMLIGLALTLIVACEFGAMLTGMVSAPTVNSKLFDPVTDAFVMLRVAVPGLLTVTGSAVLVVFTMELPKSSDTGEVLIAGPTPLPERFTVCVPSAVLSLMVSTADFVPRLDGFNEIDIVMELFGAMFVGRNGKLTVKSEAFVPDLTMLETVRLAVPLFCNVRVVVLLIVFTSWLPKSTVAGVIVMAGVVPVPDSATDCVATGMLVTRSRLAFFGPVVVGANFTVIVVLVPGVTVIGCATATKLNSAAFSPESPTELITRFAVPELRTMIELCVLVVPIGWLAKLSVAGENVKPGVTMLADRPTFAVPVPTLFVMIRLALLLPLVLAFTVTLMVAFVCGAMTRGRLEESTEKSLALKPVIASFVIRRSALPVFEIERGSVVGGVAGCVPNASEAGDRLIAGTAPMPVRATVCGTPALLEMVRVALLAPDAVGLKVTLTVADVPAAIAGTLVGLIVNSAAFSPVTLKEVIVSGAVPLLVIVIDFCALATPTGVNPKSSELPDTLIAGAVTFPDSVT